MSVAKTSTCPNCGTKEEFGTFTDARQCPECELPLTTLCRMATEEETDA